MARTPTYEEALTSRGANFGTWLDVPVIDDYGDITAEYALARGEQEELFGLADHSSRGTVIATGTEVVPLLQGIVTSDVFELATPGAGQHSTAVNSKGRLVCDLRVLHGPDDLLIMDFEPGLVEGGVISHFRANVMSEDARFIDRSAATSIIGVHGADEALLDRVGTFVRRPATLATHHGTWGELGGVDVIARRTELGFELLLATADALATWEHLEQAGGRPVGAQALDILRVEAGVPRWGAELDEKVIPLEAGLDHAISFNKGCYVGQEIIARLDTLGRPAKLLRALRLEAPASAGETVFDADKNIGTLRTVVDSPQLGTALALAYLKRDHNDIGRELRVGEVSAVVRELRDGRARRSDY